MHNKNIENEYNSTCMHTYCAIFLLPSTYDIMRAADTTATTANTIDNTTTATYRPTHIPANN